MSRDRFEAPRPEKKKKSLGEGAGDARQARISFKNYLRELEEQNEYDEDDLFEETQLPDDEDAIEEMYQAFLEENDDIAEQAREKAKRVGDKNFMQSLQDSDEEEGDPVGEAVDFFMDELEIWLQNKGHSVSDVRDWIEGPAGDTLFDKFYNGLT